MFRCGRCNKTSEGTKRKEFRSTTPQPPKGWKTLPDPRGHMVSVCDECVSDYTVFWDRPKMPNPDGKPIEVF